MVVIQVGSSASNRSRIKVDIRRYFFRLVRSKTETAFTIRSRLFVITDVSMPHLAKKDKNWRPALQETDLQTPPARFFKYDTYMLTAPAKEVKWVLDHALSKWLSNGGDLLIDRREPDRVISIHEEGVCD